MELFLKKGSLSTDNRNRFGQKIININHKKVKDYMLFKLINEQSRTNENDSNRGT